MDNVYAYRLSKAAVQAKPGGDFIDHGWSLLSELHAQGFEVIVRANFVNATLDDGKSLNKQCGFNFEAGKPAP